MESKLLWRSMIYIQQPAITGRRSMSRWALKAWINGMTKERLRRIKQLEKAIEALKQIIAEKELESKLKDELLKKKYPHLRKMI